MTILINELGYATSEPEMAKRFEAIQNHFDYKTFVAVADSKVVGLVGMIKNYFYERNGSYIRVAALIVNREYRNRNIGKELMKKAEEWAIQTSSKFILLNSGIREERKDAHLFYEKMGFETKTFGFARELIAPGYPDEK
jgi:GNAT superfamily N-acetyltransferase